MIYVVIEDVRDGDVGVEESPFVRPEGLIALLLAQRQVMSSGCVVHQAPKVVDEDFLQALLAVDGVGLQAFQPSQWS